MPPPAEIQSRVPDISFATKSVQPPSFVYVTKDDALLISYANSVFGGILTVRFRLLRPDGVILPSEIQLPLSNNRAQHSITIPLTEGFLLSGVAIATGLTTLRGQCWVNISLYRGTGDYAHITQVLAQDYVDSFEQLSFPGTPQSQLLKGPGFLSTATASDPAAGAEISISVPSRSQWKVHCGTFQLVTSATVGPRRIGLELFQSPSTVMRSGASVEIPENTTVKITMLPGIQATQLANGNIIIPLPNELIINNGATLSTVTAGLDSGDQYSAINLFVEEWNTGG